MLNPRKVAVVGCGFVGASIAFSLMQKSLFSEMVLIDANQEKAEGEAMDLSHGLPYASAMDIYAGTYEDLADSALAIITAGANQKPGETRLDLIEKNVKILKSIIPQITATSFEGILMVVSNPVDILTYEAQRISGYPIHRVIGSGNRSGHSPVEIPAQPPSKRGQPECTRHDHRRTRRQRAGRLEPDQHLRHRPGRFLQGPGTRELPGGDGGNLQRGAQQRL